MLRRLGGRIYENDDYYDIKELFRNKSLHLCNSFWEKRQAAGSFKGHNLHKNMLRHIGFSFSPTVEWNLCRFFSSYWELFFIPFHLCYTFSIATLFFKKVAIEVFLFFTNLKLGVK